MRADVLVARVGGVGAVGAVGLGVVVAVLAACAMAACGGSDEAPPVCREQPSPPVIDVDAGIICAGEPLDHAFLLGQAGSSLTATSALPAGLSLALRDGAWRLRGTVGDVEDFRDVSFNADYTDGAADCPSHTPVHVRLVLDSCDGTRAVCEPAAEAFPIAGFCLPAHIDADFAFSVLTHPDACLGSSCHEVRPSACNVAVAGNRITIGGDTCVASLGVACTADCGGGAGAPCQIPALPAGQYVIASTTTSSEVAFDVPRARGADAALDCVQ